MSCLACVSLRQTHNKYIVNEAPTWPSEEYFWYPKEFTKEVESKFFWPLEKVIKQGRPEYVNPNPPNSSEDVEPIKLQGIVDETQVNLCFTP